MSWTDVSFPYASTLTAAKLNQLQANFAAITSAASGAPSIVTAAIEPGAIRIYHLSEAQASGSVVVAGNGESTYTLTGGTYSWWTMSSTGSGGFSFKSGNQAAGVVGLGNNDFVNSQTFYVDENYIQASPPYNLGNGDIPLFVFILLDETGSILGSSVAADPPWAYHGPTDITPHRVATDGRRYRSEKFAGGRLVRELNTKEFIAFMRRGGQLEIHEVEIDHVWKNKDSNLFPHPFHGASQRVLMVDPLGPLMSHALKVYEIEGAKEVRRLMESAKFTTMENSFRTPPGVLAVQGVLR
jgi:hypothetical protein